MAKSDLDALLERARNQSSAGCRVTAALARLDNADRDKLRAAILERSEFNASHWAYLDNGLAEVLTNLAGIEVGARSIRTYRKNHA